MHPEMVGLVRSLFKKKKEKGRGAVINMVKTEKEKVAYFLMKALSSGGT